LEVPASEEVLGSAAARQKSAWLEESHAGGGNRTHTRVAPDGILTPLCHRRAAIPDIYMQLPDLVSSLFPNDDIFALLFNDLFPFRLDLQSEPGSFPSLKLPFSGL
jgi:hypothetical protein